MAISDSHYNHRIDVMCPGGDIDVICQGFTTLLEGLIGVELALTVGAMTFERSEARTNQLSH